MSEYLQEITIKKLLENKKLQEASNNDIIKYPLEGYNVPDDRWEGFVQDIKKYYKIEATKENNIIYLKGSRKNLATFMMRELEIADINIVDYPKDDSNVEQNDAITKEAESIIDSLKKSLKHVDDYTFQISQGGAEIDINNKSFGNPPPAIQAYIKIEDGYYKLYNSYRTDRAGYVYLGFTFREKDLNKFIEKTIAKFNQLFYAKEEPEKPTPKNQGKLTEFDYNILNILDQLCEKYNNIVKDTISECYEKNYSDGYLTKRCSYPYSPYCRYKFLSQSTYIHHGQSSKKEVYEAIIQQGKNLMNDLEKAFNIKIKSSEINKDNEAGFSYIFDADKELPVQIHFDVKEILQVPNETVDYKYQWDCYVYIFRSTNDFSYKG